LCTTLVFHRWRTHAQKKLRGTCPLRMWIFHYFLKSSNKFWKFHTVGPPHIQKINFLAHPVSTLLPRLSLPSWCQVI
jgi:hypothetical protein